MHYELYLPFPPSNNNYYVKTRRGVFISQKGRKFRDDLNLAVGEQLPGISIDERMLVETIYFMPDKRIRDIANYSKALHDAITESGLWEDDSLIDQNFEYRGDVMRSGGVFMRIVDAAPIFKIGQTPPED
jgi:crossover junction endodeoxyribonuclease RusA